MLNGDNYYTRGVLDHIATDKKLPPANAAQKAKAKEQIARVMGMTLDDSPLHQANRATQQAVVASLAAAPLVLISALGEADAIREAQRIQRALLPERPKDKPDARREAELVKQRAALAVNVLKEAGIPAPEALVQAAEAALPPEPEPKPARQPPAPPAKPAAGAPAPTMPAANVASERAVPEANSLEGSVERFIADYRKTLPAVAGGQPLVQYRCQLELSTDFPIMSEVCDMEGKHWQSMRVRTHAATIGEANDIKKSLQRHVLHSGDVVPFREMHGSASFVSNRDDVVPDVPPEPRSLIPTPISGRWGLRLEFVEQGRRVDMQMHLGLAQGRPAADAADRRDWIVQRLHTARTKQETLTRGQLSDELQQAYAHLWEQPRTRAAQGIPEEITTTPQMVGGTML
ncbi:MAG: hypothetical protein K2Q01_06355, partial [Rickettsiales bacterium]|nr:hypothetical protein [Rickettsiales bacterium]